VFKTSAQTEHCSYSCLCYWNWCVVIS